MLMHVRKKKGRRRQDAVRTRVEKQGKRGVAASKEKRDDKHKQTIKARLDLRLTGR